MKQLRKKFVGRWGWKRCRASAFHIRFAVFYFRKEVNGKERARDLIKSPANETKRNARYERVATTPDSVRIELYRKLVSPQLERTCWSKVSQEIEWTVAILQHYTHLYEQKRIFVKLFDLRVAYDLTII